MVIDDKKWRKAGTSRRFHSLPALFKQSFRKVSAPPYAAGAGIDT